MISLQDCKNGQLYHVYAHNFRFGVFDAIREGFWGIRTKFGKRYLDLEVHYSAHPHLGTASPTEALGIWPVGDLRHDSEELFSWIDKNQPSV